MRRGRYPTVTVNLRLQEQLMKRIAKLQELHHWRNRTVAIETLLHEAVIAREAAAEEKP